MFLSNVNSRQSFSTVFKVNVKIDFESSPEAIYAPFLRRYSGERDEYSRKVIANPTYYLNDVSVRELMYILQNGKNTAYETIRNIFKSNDRDYIPTDKHSIRSVAYFESGNQFYLVTGDDAKTYWENCTKSNIEDIKSQLASKSDDKILNIHSFAGLQEKIKIKSIDFRA